MLVRIIDLIVLVACVTTISSYVTSVRFNMPRKTTKDNPRDHDQRHRARNHHGRTVLSPPSPWSIPSPSCFLRFFLHSLLLTCKRGNGASNTKPPFHSTQFTSPAARVHTMSIVTAYPVSVTSISTCAQYRAHRNRI